MWIIAILVIVAIAGYVIYNKNNNTTPSDSVSGGKPETTTNVEEK